MAKITKVTVNYQRTFNLGDFNSLRLSVMPSIEFEDGDDINEVMGGVWEMCRKNVEHAARPIVSGYKKVNPHGITKKELFLGLPVEVCEVVEIEEADNAN